MQPVEQVLAANKRALDHYVFRILPEKHSVKEINLLYGMMRDYPSRPSKGLRPSICILTCQALGGRLEDALPTAAALELFHNWILIHDDLEDGSLMRRGQPALHKRYSIPLSINTGDALHGRMWGVLLENERLLGASKTIRLAKEFMKMTNETTEGQHMELTWIEQNKWDLKEEDYYSMCGKKTAWYTCTSPCRMGAIIAGASEEFLEELVSFGLNMGIAFQMTDDLLNLVGDERKYGKEGAGDILEGKRSLMLIRLLNTCSDEDRKWLLSVLAKPRGQRTMEEARVIIDMMNRYSALDYAKQLASEYASKARLQFESLFKDAPNKEAATTLRQLIAFMVEREW